MCAVETIYNLQFIKKFFKKKNIFPECNIFSGNSFYFVFDLYEIFTSVQAFFFKLNSIASSKTRFIKICVSKIIMEITNTFHNSSCVFHNGGKIGMQ